MLDIQQGIISIMDKINFEDNTGYLENAPKTTDTLLDFINACKKIISNIETEIKNLEI